MNTLYPDQVNRLIKYSEGMVWPILKETQEETRKSAKVEISLDFLNQPDVKEADVSLDEDTQFITKVQIDKLLEEKI